VSDKRVSSGHSANMSTTRPPLSRHAMFLVGFISAGALAVLVSIILLFTGFFVSPEAYQEAVSNSELAIREAEQLKAENQQMRGQSEADASQIESLQKELDKTMTELLAVKKEAREVEEQVNVFVEKEQEVEFSVNRRQMEIEELARRVHRIEGVQVKVMENGILVSGLSSPFALGSSQLNDDTLTPKLGEIAEVFKAVNAGQSTKYYAAAVGNTDSSPVKQWSGHYSNLWLGAKRARTLSDAMLAAGFPKDEVFLISWGSIKAQGELINPESRKAELYIVAQDALKSGQLVRANDMTPADEE